MNINIYPTGRSAMIILAATLLQPLAAQPAQPSEETSVWTERRVCADLRTPAPVKARTAFLIASRAQAGGSFSAVAFYPDGTLRMDGRFLDAALTIPAGEFRFYHPNGRLESQGHYVGGYKAGAWTCYAPTGEMKAERYYIAGDWERIQLALGLAELAPTVGDERTDRARF